MHRILTLVALVFAIACQDSAASATESAAPWYRRAVARNLTQGTQPDSIIIEAHGQRPDSLRIHLSIIVDGREAYATDWKSSYELVDADTTILNTPRMDSVMKQHLDRVFTTFNEEPLDTLSMRLNGDTVLLRNLPHPLPHQFTLSYGYRSTIALVWDAREHRFLTASSCC